MAGEVEPSRQDFQRTNFHKVEDSVASGRQTEKPEGRTRTKLIGDALDTERATKSGSSGGDNISPAELKNPGEIRDFRENQPKGELPRVTDKELPAHTERVEKPPYASRAEQADIYKQVHQPQAENAGERSGRIEPGAKASPGASEQAKLSPSKLARDSSSPGGDNALEPRRGIDSGLKTNASPSADIKSDGQPGAPIVDKSNRDGATLDGSNKAGPQDSRGTQTQGQTFGEHTDGAQKNPGNRGRDSGSVESAGQTGAANSPGKGIVEAEHRAGQSRLRGDGGANSPNPAAAELGAGQGKNSHTILEGSTVHTEAGKIDNQQRVPTDAAVHDGEFRSTGNRGKALGEGAGASSDLTHGSGHDRTDAASKGKGLIDGGAHAAGGAPAIAGESHGAGKGLIANLGEARIHEVGASKSDATTKHESGSTSIEAGAGKVRSGELIDHVSTADASERGAKHGVKADGRIDAKFDGKGDGPGKRIHLNGEEILVWDGKNSPLYPGQAGKRISRFVDDGKSANAANTSKGKPFQTGKGKFGDPKTFLDPKDRAHIDRVIKETDRIFFGDKSSKGKGKAADSRAESATRSERKGILEPGKTSGTGKAGELGDTRAGRGIGRGDLRTGKSADGTQSPARGEVRSGKLQTSVSKPDRGDMSASTGAKAGANAGSGERGKSLVGKLADLPNHVPLPELKLPEFKIRWPSGKGNAAEGKSSGHAEGKHDGRTEGKADIKAGGRAGAERLQPVDTKTVKVGLGAVGNKSMSGRLDQNVRSIKDSMKVLLPESRVGVSRSFTLGGRSFSGATDGATGPQFKPTRIALGPRVNVDATFTPASVLVQPINWSGLKGWFDIQGVLSAGKGKIVRDGRPGSGPSVSGPGVDTSTVKVSDSRSGKAQINATDKVASSADGKIRAPRSEKVASGKVASSADGQVRATGPEKVLSDKVSSSAGKGQESAKQAGSDKGKTGEATFGLKEGKDAFEGKLPSIKMTYKPESGQVKPFAGSKVEQIANVNPLTAPKGGQPVSDMGVAKTTDRAPANSLLDADLLTGKSSKSESDAAKGKGEFDRGKLILEGKETRSILRELLFTTALKGGFSRRLDKGLDGVRVVDGAHLISMYIGMQQAKASSIREVLAGLRYSSAKRSFTPEITESGSYKVARGHSSQQMIAFGSSARHMAVNMQADASDEEIAVKSNFGTEEDLSDTKSSVGGQSEKVHDRATNSEESRKWYIVKEGETVDFIAVVELNDSKLAPLIHEINKPLFEQIYDMYKQEHVDTLPAGTMILLPNKFDIAKFNEDR